jgi:5-dehydro-2-deoxygluconokinase
LQNEYRERQAKVNRKSWRGFGGMMRRLWDRMRLARILVLGRVGMDLYADPPGTRIEEATRYVSAIGGSAGNIAVALARQGVGTGLISCLSDDAVGRYCRAELARYGVDTQHIRSVAGGARTSLAVTETRSDGCQTVLYRNGAADFDLAEADVEPVDFARLAALVVTGTALAAEPSRGAALLAIRRAKAAGALVVLDIDYRAYSWASRDEAAGTCLMAARAADIVVGNDEEFDLLARGTDGLALARQIAQESALLVVYKQGAAGSVTLTADYQFVTGIYPVTALKPTGAGDGFMGGLLAGLARGHTLDAAVRRGSATAAIIVSGIGCASASPDSAKLETFMAQY